MPSSLHPEPFRVHITDAALRDLRDRLGRTALPDDFGNADWRYGVERGWLADMLRFWADDFEWRVQEARINAIPQWRVWIDDIPVHFAHIHGKGPRPMPLVLTHGWPWTFWDWHALIGPLTDPAAFGGSAEDAFDLVIPSLPGFGFSEPLRVTGVDDDRVADLWVTLMTAILGYTRFGAAGGDFGSFITSTLGQRHADRLYGAHMTLPVVPGVDLRAIDAAAYASDEQWMRARTVVAADLIRSHVAVHSYDPQTLAYALTDSPAGLAAWIWERRRAWSDCDGDILSVFDRNFLCTTASIYWFTSTIGTSMRYYWERRRAPKRPAARIDVPTGFAIAPKELMLLPKALAAKHADLHRWTIMPKGGHFLPAEQPDLLVCEYREFFRPLR